MSNYTKFIPGQSYTKEEINKAFILDNQLLFKQDPEISENMICTPFFADLLQGGGLAAQIQARNDNGDSEDVSLGFGLGVRQHDDVMLAFGYSKTTGVSNVSIPSGQFLILRLDVGAITRYHHTENRAIITQGASVKVQLYEVDPSEFNLFPANPITMKIVNENGPSVENGNAIANFFNYVVQASNPFAGLPAGRTFLPTYVRVQEALGPATADVASVFGSIKGRHYTANKTYALVIQNIGTVATIFDYIYSWHEK